jgi:hypothetical protein
MYPEREANNFEMDREPSREGSEPDEDKISADFSAMMIQTDTATVDTSNFVVPSTDTPPHKQKQYNQTAKMLFSNITPKKRKEKPERLEDYHYSPARDPRLKRNEQTDINAAIYQNVLDHISPPRSAVRLKHLFNQ